MFVRRTLRVGLAVACVACGALLAAGPLGWGIGVGVGAAVALGNFWLLARAVLRVGSGRGGPAGGGARRWGAALKGAVLRIMLAGAALGLAIVFLPVHPLGVAAGLVGVHAAMVIAWVAVSLAGIRS